MRIRHLLLAPAAAALLAGCTIPFGPWSGDAARAGASPAPTAGTPTPGVGYASLQGVDWVVDDPAFIDPEGGRTPFMRFLDEGRVSGSGGCNRFSGPAAISAAGLRIGPLASTRMACPDGAMRTEARFLAAVETVRGARTEEGRLVLLDAAGKPVLRLARAQGAGAAAPAPAPAAPGATLAATAASAADRVTSAGGTAAAAGPGLAAAAAARGVTFLGRGNEPGWRIEIGPGDAVRVVYGYGTVRVDFPSLPARRLASGETVHEGSSGAHVVRITLRQAPCTDDMSGEAYPTTVLLRFDSEERRGCGGPPAG